MGKNNVLNNNTEKASSLPLLPIDMATVPNGNLDPAHAQWCDQAQKTEAGNKADKKR